MDLNNKSVKELHEIATILWYTGAEDVTTGVARIRPLSAIDRLILMEHVANSKIWRLENSVRSAGASAAVLTRERQEINSERNNLVYEINSAVFQQHELWLRQAKGELYAESPGSIVDRMSILRLKIFHGMDATEELDDLGMCLDQLLQGVKTGQKYFKLYRPLKVYEDDDCRHYPVT